MANDVQMVRIVLDEGLWSSIIGIVPWLSMLIVPAIGIRALFLLPHRSSDKARRSARRCYLGLHVQSAFALIVGTWMSLRAWFPLRQEFGSSAVLPSLQNWDMSHMLWLVGCQCFIATVAAWVVMTCSGLRPRLWRPDCAVISICLCSIAQVISLGLFRIIGH